MHRVFVRVVLAVHHPVTHLALGYAHVFVALHHSRLAGPVGWESKGMMINFTDTRIVAPKSNIPSASEVVWTPNGDSLTTHEGISVRAILAQRIVGADVLAAHAAVLVALQLARAARLVACTSAQRTPIATSSVQCGDGTDRQNNGETTTHSTAY